MSASMRRPEFQDDAGPVEVVDVIGDHLGAAVADCGEHVAVGYQAEPLIPGVVSRGLKCSWTG